MLQKPGISSGIYEPVGSKASLAISVKNMQRIFTLDKREARVILGADNNRIACSCLENWIGFHFIMRTMVYKRLSEDCPSHMSQMLIRNTEINERPSRHGLLNLVCPLCHPWEGWRSRHWYIRNIKSKPNLASFKNVVSDHFKDSCKNLLRSFYLVV